ncbi:MAG: hypothetical protein NVS4B3_03810 [Gemmatimonadaceae bacterium]
MGAVPGRGKRDYDARRDVSLVGPGAGSNPARELPFLVGIATLAGMRPNRSVVLGSTAVTCPKSHASIASTLVPFSVRFDESAPMTTPLVDYTPNAVGTAVRLLVVDDEEGLRGAFGKYLRGHGYAVETAASGAAALELLGQAIAARDRFSLVLCDVRMPGMSGLEVVRQAVGRDEDLAVIMITAVNDAPTATEALSSGALDYLVKPIALEDLRAAIERGLHTRDLAIEQRRIERLIREEVALRTAELEEEERTLRATTVGIAESLINAMEAKDIFLRGHSQRVAEMGASIAHAMGLDEETVERVRLAGRLQDVGKIGVNEAALNKPGPLTPEEFDHVKQHVKLGVEILSPLKHLGPALTYVQDHHEHFSGRGYPRGLKGEQISMGGRILCAADAFDALTSRRPYRQPLEPAAALDLLANSVGILLDPSVYAALRSVVLGRQSLVFLDHAAG